MSLERFKWEETQFNVPFNLIMSIKCLSLRIHNTWKSNFVNAKKALGNET